VKRKIAIFTGTRAEYGLLYWLMKDIQASETLELQIIAAAMHFSPEFGETWKQIEKDGFHIDAKVEMLLSSDSAVGVAKSIGLGTIGFADALDRLHPDAVVVLGDRFEALALSQTAMVLRIPIVHLHGGEITEGAYDDAIRHAITKMASLHLVAAEPYRQRVIQMGEPPHSVVLVGSIGLDHLYRSSIQSLPELSASLGFTLRKPYFLATYHPVTAADECPEATTSAMLRAFEAFLNHQIILTYPNADNGGREIIPLLEAFASRQTTRVLVVPNLGHHRYLSVLSHSDAMIGNSSSGLVEAPALGIPTVNIGARQKGRLAAESVIHCSPDGGAIIKAIQKALSPEHKAFSKTAHNPYGKGNASHKILSALCTVPLQPKRFFDLPLPHVP